MLKRRSTIDIGMCTPEPVVYPRSCLHGHLRHERYGSLASVERPFMGKPSAFIALINVDGGIMFEVFVGRDGARQLKANRLEKFRALAKSF